jgi:uncharacterized protein YwqG
MGIFNIFKKQKSKEQLVNLLIQFIKNKTKKDAYTINLLPEISPSIFHSKLGGIPYWDLDKEFPKDEKGNFMTLLCQINFSEENVEGSILPQEGILQFFISTDDPYFGTSDDYNYTNNKNFRIIYHEKINEQITKEQIIQKYNLSDSQPDSSPILHEVCFSLKKETVYLSPISEDFTPVFQEAVKEIFNIDFEDEYYDLLDNKHFDNGKTYGRKLRTELKSNQSYLLGYPYFCQGDPRQSPNTPQQKPFDTVLLQLDSSTNSDYIMWGDMGIGNFLINSEDLQNCDFSNVIYYWDCD